MEKAKKVKKTVTKKAPVVIKKIAVKAIKPAVAAKKLHVVPAAAVSTEKIVAAPVKKKTGEDKMFSLIQDKAYELFVIRGCVAGSDLGDWYEAEVLVKKELGI